MWGDLLNLGIIVSVLAATIRIATPILFSALGEVTAERAGVYNMGIEGTMLMGAFIGWLATYESGSSLVGLVAALLAGAVMSLIFAVMVISLKIDQIVTGLALNLLGSGLSTYWLRAAFADMEKVPGISVLRTSPVPLLSDIRVIGPILFNQGLLTYLAFLLVPVIWLFLFRSRLGLEIRCIGENPKALDIKGHSVAARQYGAVIFGGAMAGLGGACLTIASTAHFVPDMVNGRGWLALVIVIAGGWRPGWILAAALFFSFLDALQLQIQGVGIAIPYQILLALPYIAAIVALMIRRRASRAPAMLGVSYRRE
ncbi:ABC transporter permease [Dongia soli]|uniref:ABC transporter permease n=1 Tax=Dongia soli TaxID=600628 RepID=A0ABU5E594_9PROT|nr:ABC transporter permease [Dongia soli]MDY0881473.1 ABC transporter permease [Dongia soli]